jgi:uncharacterized protein YceK
VIVNIYKRKVVGGGDSYHKDNIEFFDRSPLQGVLVILVGGILCCRYVVRNTSTREGSFLNKYIGNQAVDDRRADWGVRSRPQHHTRGGKNLKSVQHHEISKIKYVDDR